MSKMLTIYSNSIKLEYLYFSIFSSEYGVNSNSSFSTIFWLLFNLLFMIIRLILFIVLQYDIYLLMKEL